MCFLKAQGLDLSNNGFLVTISLGCSLSLLTLKHRYCKFLNHCSKKTSWNFILWVAFQYNLVMKWTLHNSKVTNPTYWRSGITFFSLMKKEKFTSDELEQGSYSELPHKFVSRESYAVLTSYNIPEMRDKKQQKIGISYFTAHSHKNWTMINLNYLYFFCSYFLSHTNILKLYLNIPKWLFDWGCWRKLCLFFQRPWRSSIFRLYLIFFFWKSEIEQTLIKTKLNTSKKLQTSNLIFYNQQPDQTQRKINTLCSASGYLPYGDKKIFLFQEKVL